MCGRYVLNSSGDVIFQAFGVDREEAAVKASVKARYNIGPGQDAPIVRASAGRPSLKSLHWGFVPAKKGGRFLINARSETVSELPSFSRAFKTRRCLVPASGFFEWKKHGPARAPYYLELRDDDLFAMAGLWRRGGALAGDGADSSYVILTTVANTLVGEIHNRMPVILERRHFEAWLDPENPDVEALERLLKPLPAERMVTHPVSSYVNKVSNDGPRCIEEAEPEPQQQTLF